MAKEKAKADEKIIRISLSKLHESPLNPRQDFSKESLRDLRDSIHEKGIIEPLILRENKKGFEIICGARRYRAGLMISKDMSVPAVVREYSDEEAVDIMLAENMQREGLLPIDEGEVYKKMLDEGRSAKDIGSVIGKNARYVMQRASLASLIPEIKTAMKKGLPLGHALLLARVGDEKQQKAFLKEITGKKGESGEIEYSDFGRLDRIIQSNAFVSISEAQFDITDKVLLKGVPACGECQYLSTNKASLFDEKENARCTNRPCFENKQTAQYNILKKDHVLLPEKEYEGLFNYAQKPDPNQKKWVNIDWPVIADKKRRKVSEIIGTEVEAVLARHPSSGFFFLLSKRIDVVKALAAHGIKTDSETTTASGKPKPTKKEKIAKQVEKEKKKIAKLVIEGYQKVVAEAKAEMGIEWCDLVAFMLCCSGYKPSEILKKRGVDLSVSEGRHEQIIKYIRSLTYFEVCQFIIELQLAEAYNEHTSENQRTVIQKQVEEVFGISYGDVEKQVLADMRKIGEEEGDDKE